ncbi:MAG TPA: 50S ribosomal protein L29 [Nitrospiria bacterium]|nr:50S ribosomal protein L29 [Nitrospiria bacterium]
MDIRELRNLEPEELDKKEKELRKELFNLRFQVMSEQISNPQRITDARREIARVKTVLKEKQNNQANSGTQVPEGN